MNKQTAIDLQEEIENLNRTIDDQADEIEKLEKGDAS